MKSLERLVIVFGLSFEAVIIEKTLKEERTNKNNFNVQILAPFEVQVVPVAAAPVAQVHTFCVHTRFADDEHAVVCLVPVPQADRHPVQVLPVL